MRKVRGIVALVIAVVAGLLAARGVGYVLTRPAAPSAKPPPAKAQAAVDQVKLTIPVGMREVAVRVDEVTGVSRELKPGDCVDVLTIARLADRKAGSVARMLIENAAVYRVGGGRTEVVKRLVTQKKSWTVSLLLKPEQGAVLLAAAKSADIALMVRQAAGKTGDPETRPVLSTDNREYVFLGAGGILIRGEEENDHNNRIPEDLRAITIEVNASDGVQGIFRAGDRVDVIYSSPVGIFNTQSNVAVGTKGVVTEKRAMSMMLLQDVAVLGADDITPLAADTRKKVKRVTLALSPQKILKLSSVLDAGGAKARIRLVHRHPDDHGRPALETAYVTDILTRKRASRRVAVIKGTNRDIIPFFK